MQPPPYAMPQRGPGGSPQMGGYGAPPSAMGPPMGVPPPTLEPSLPYEAKGGGYVKRIVSPKNVFISTGVLLLAMLCVVPVWNAVALMSDLNYVFWVGSSVPTWMICLCAGIVALYVVTIAIFFSTARPQVQTEQTIMMIANVFITLLGLILMLLSLPLSRQSVDTYNNLMHRCDYSEQTHRMYEYSQVLHNIRRQPSCIGKFSVEECAGYEDAPPYTTMLKSMEADFHCAGFCNRRLVSASAAAISAEANTSKQVVNEFAVPNSKRQRKHQDHSSALALAEDGDPGRARAITQYPPTLFSDANYQASCEGMAARDMKNFAGDVGFQTFYQGIYLVLIAIATGFLKLIGLCMRKDQDGEFKAPGF